MAGRVAGRVAGGLLDGPLRSRSASKASPVRVLMARTHGVVRFAVPVALMNGVVSCYIGRARVHVDARDAAALIYSTFVAPVLIMRSSSVIL